MLQEYVSAWNRDRPATAGRFASPGDDSVSPVGAVSYIAEATKQSDPDGRGVPEKTIQNLVAARFPVTELRIADAVVSAIDRPHLFHDGTLEIRQNPLASRKSLATCCGGSAPSDAT